MEEIFQLADELGPAKVIHVHEPGMGLKGILVADNAAPGPSIGELRMALDVSPGMRAPRPCPWVNIIVLLAVVMHLLHRWHRLPSNGEKN